MTHYINKGGRPPVANKCSHHVKVSVNYDLTVRTLRENFTEKKAMTALYKLEKLTIEMVGVMSEVVSLSEKFEQQWSLKSR